MTRRTASNDDLVDAVARAALAYLGHRERSIPVLSAMRAIDRALFLPASRRADAYFDHPVSIGFGQTCSEPSMVAFMLDMLDPLPGNRLLEIGSGCGYAAAIAALLCGPEGLVYAVEILPELAAKARINCATCFPGGAFGPAIADRIVFIEGDGSLGLPARAPFDRILISAGVSRDSFREEPFLKQLVPDGALIYPRQLGQMTLVRKARGGPIREWWSGVAFVPLRGKNA